MKKIFEVIGKMIIFILGGYLTFTLVIFFIMNSEKVLFRRAQKELLFIISFSLISFILSFIFGGVLSLIILAHFQKKYSKK